MKSCFGTDENNINDVVSVGAAAKKEQEACRDLAIFSCMLRNPAPLPTTTTAGARENKKKHGTEIWLFARKSQVQSRKSCFGGDENNINDVVFVDENNINDVVFVVDD